MVPISPQGGALNDHSHHSAHTIPRVVCTHKLHPGTAPAFPPSSEGFCCIRISIMAGPHCPLRHRPYLGIVSNSELLHGCEPERYSIHVRWRSMVRSRIKRHWARIRLLHKQHVLCRSGKCVRTHLQWLTLVLPHSRQLQLPHCCVMHEQHLLCSVRI